MFSHHANVLHKSLLLGCLATLLVLFSVSQAAAVPVYSNVYSFMTFQTTSHPDIRDEHGWTSNTGLTFTAVGFELEWILYPHTTGVWKIKDEYLADVTGNGPFPDRYISTTIDPASWGWDDWITTITHSFTTNQQDLGEGFQIRSSLDGFAVPLVEIIGTIGIATGTFAAGTDTTSYFARFAGSNHSPVHTTGTPVQVEDGPIELRYYYWDTANTDGMGAGYSWTKDGGAQTGSTPWTISAQSTGASIPDPGTVWLLGTGLLGIAGLGRKRFKK